MTLAAIKGGQVLRVFRADPHAAAVGDAGDRMRQWDRIEKMAIAARFTPTCGRGLSSRKPSGGSVRRSDCS